MGWELSKSTHLLVDRQLHRHQGHEDTCVDRIHLLATDRVQSSSSTVHSFTPGAYSHISSTYIDTPCPSS